MARNTFPTAARPSFSSIPLNEEQVVRDWTRPLCVHFPRLEKLEAWGDWTGSDNYSLNYLLPMKALLPITWEFLSGFKQDLFDGEDVAEEVETEADKCGGDTAGRPDFGIQNKDADWEHVSLVDEFPGDDEVLPGADIVDAHEQLGVMVLPYRPRHRD